MQHARDVRERAIVRHRQLLDERHHIRGFPERNLSIFERPLGRRFATIYEGDYFLPV